MSNLLINPEAYRWRFPDAQSQHDAHVISRLVPYEPRPFSEDEVDYVLVDDHIEARLKYPDRPTSLGEDALKVAYEGPWHLCNSCRSALGYLVRHNQEKRIYRALHPQSVARTDETHPARQPFSAIQHGSFSALLRAESQGCHICRIIANRCRQDVYEVMKAAPVERPPFIELLFNEDHETCKEIGDFRLICAFNTVRQNDPPAKHNYVNVVRFQLWPSPETDHYFVSKDTIDIGGLAMQDSDDSDDSDTTAQDDSKSWNTRSSRRRAVRWLRDCIDNENGEHAKCNANNSGWLPSRVLDISRFRDSGKVRVTATSNIERREGSRYISLSHCWGEWGGRQNLPMLTQATLSSMQTEGLEYDLLPQTFKDAVDVTSWFDVQYLWIDSLCIIQDSEFDWAAEAAQMAYVYRNALLNISASSSPDARSGCFSNRDPAGYEPFKLKFEGDAKSWWVTLDERNLFDWVNKAPLMKRAWVYQERQLSRRVLYFTKSEVFWECMAEKPSFRSETWTEGSPLKRAFLGQEKFADLSTTSLRAAGSEGEGIRPKQNIWDEVLEGFTKRRLTYPTDKLPSLSGLASQIAKSSLEDAYLAGHWRSGLPRSLLWSVDDSEKSEHYPTVQNDQNQFVVPSWSWLSVDRAVQAPPFSSMHSLLHIDLIDTTPYGFDGYGRITSARLQVTGLMRRITCSTEPSPFTGFAFELYNSLGTAEQKNLYVDDDLGRGRHIGFVCGAPSPHYYEQPDDTAQQSNQRNYHCLFVGVAITRVHGALRRSLHCLLLKQVQVEGERYFQRVGVMSVADGQCAMRLRYRAMNDYVFEESDEDIESFKEEPVVAGSMSDLDERAVTGSSSRMNKTPDKERTEDSLHKESNEGQGKPSSRRESVTDDEKWQRWQRLSAPWRRAWRKIEPHWADGDYDRPPKEIRITSSGPLSLYEYDGGVELEGFEKLVPETINLI